MCIPTCTDCSFKSSWIKWKAEDLQRLYSFSVMICPEAQFVIQILVTLVCEMCHQGMTFCAICSFFFFFWRMGELHWCWPLRCVIPISVSSCWTEGPTSGCATSRTSKEILLACLHMYSGFNRDARKVIYIHALFLFIYSIACPNRLLNLMECLS